MQDNLKTDKTLMEEKKLPQIENLSEITPETARQYIEFVAELRAEQTRYFTFRRPESFKRSKALEGLLDKFNKYILDESPKLF